MTVDRSAEPGYTSLVIIDGGAEVIRATGSSSFTQLNIGMNNIYVGGVSPTIIPSKILRPGEEVSAHTCTRTRTRTHTHTHNIIINTLLIFHSPTQVWKLVSVHCTLTMMKWT